LRRHPQHTTFVSYRFSPFLIGGLAPPIRTDLSREKIAEVLRRATSAIIRGTPDYKGFSRVFYGAVAQSLFESIYSAYLDKSGHLTDDLGVSWDDLEASTKAYGRLDAREGLSLPGPPGRPTLNKFHDRIWRSLFVLTFHKLKGRLGEETARKIAASTAWNEVKSLGASTLISLLKSKRIPLMIRSGRLLESLKPVPLGADGGYRPQHPDQIMRVRRSGLTLGTKVPYAIFADAKRPLWPKYIGPWLSKAVDRGRDAVLVHFYKVLYSM